MKRAKVRTLKGSLLQITYFTAIIGTIMLAGLGYSLRSLFQAKVMMTQAQDISVYLEKAAVNLGEITAAMRGYLLDNTLEGEWQDRGVAEDSALGNLEVAKRNAPDPEVADLVDKLSNMLSSKLKGMEDQFGDLVKKDPAAAKKFYFGDYVSQRQEFDASLNLARSKAKDLASRYGAYHNQLLYMNGFIMGGLLLVTVVAIVLLSLWIASSVNRRIKSITDSLTQSEVRVGDASSNLLHASEQLSSGATEAAASLEETMSSVEELSSMVNQNAESAREASELSQSAKGAAENGESEVGRLIEAMTRIASGSRKIEEIIGVIDDIAFQTNLLALNAAVEAARAGEQGKGFAVVAEAVRSLAQRSASAAKDITNLIKESVTTVETGVKIADSSGAVLKEIVGSVRRVSELNNQIAVASREQANGISQIAGAMTQLDQATQTNAACAEEVAASSQIMSSEAQELEDQVDQLVAMIGASTSAAAISAHKAQTQAPVNRARAAASPMSDPEAPVELRNWSNSRRSALQQASGEAVEAAEPAKASRGRVARNVSGF